MKTVLKLIQKRMEEGFWSASSRRGMFLMCMWSTSIWYIKGGGGWRTETYSPGRGGLQLSRWEEMKAEAKETYHWSGNRKSDGHWRCEKKNTRKCMWAWDSGNKCVSSIEKQNSYLRMSERVMLLWVHCHFCLPGYKPLVSFSIILYIKWY